MSEREASTSLCKPRILVVLRGSKPTTSQYLFKALFQPPHITISIQSFIKTTTNMQTAKNAAASVKETAANVAASAKSGMEKTKATLQEKVPFITFLRCFLVLLFL